MVDCFRKVTAAEGFGALWAGVGPRMVVVGALFGVSMLSFEMLKLQLKHAGNKSAAAAEAASREQARYASSGAGAKGPDSDRA